jgi:2-phosphosulfolactate phosphatase
VTTIRYVELADAAPDDTVVVIDVLRAFTLVPWLYARGASRVLAVDTRERALALRGSTLPQALLAGEHGGEPYPDFDLGNSPAEVADRDLGGATVVHRTSAGTQGLERTRGSGRVLAASFVTAAATASHLRRHAPDRVTFVITGASLGRDGDEDLACAELIAARLDGSDPDPAPYLARVPASDAGRHFGDDGPDWASPADLALAVEVDRFDHALVARAAADVDALDVAVATP